MALANDPFGNYLVQKLLQYGVTEQRTKLIAIAAEELLAIALNVHGTRVVQKMVERPPTPLSRCLRAPPQSAATAWS